MKWRDDDGCCQRAIVFAFCVAVDEFGPGAWNPYVHDGAVGTAAYTTET